MSEKYPHTQHNSGENPLDQPVDAAPSTESDDREQQLRWDISDALLKAIDDAVVHRSDQQPAATAELALALVQLTHSFDLNSETGKHALATRANYISDQLNGLVRHYDDLTTSDLQGGVEALAFMLVSNQLPTDNAESSEGGEHE
ncbi:hypothetical protein [Nocardia wallacei]|uniref:Uncharacterized protein n=1 Tax=Nocardia wallacei TaxID=480035 RepID=A0A7G1KRM6_9NOCA|nr:hypothetical protein [Nocardia wallacei]BCK57895.1 hypothetical protein NWFMUON74_56670 [Nocardia wallacei]